MSLVRSRALGLAAQLRLSGATARHRSALDASASTARNRAARCWRAHPDLVWLTPVEPGHVGDNAPSQLWEGALRALAFSSALDDVLMGFGKMAVCADLCRSRVRACVLGGGLSREGNGSLPGERAGSPTP